MKKDYKVYLYHILESITAIEEFTKGVRRGNFLRERIVQDAVIRNLEIIGEASKKIPPSIRNKHAHIEWQKIAGMRDVLIHNYLGVDLDRVWNVLKKRLPQLKKDIQAIIDEG